MTEREIENKIVEPVKDAAEITVSLLTPVAKRLGPLAAGAMLREIHARKQRRVSR